jgi:hypothetical protein
MAITPIAYDPTTDTWHALPAPPVERRQNRASVWTGTAWIVWGDRNGRNELADDAAHDPATVTWRVLTPSPLAARHTRPCGPGPR